MEQNDDVKNSKLSMEERRLYIDEERLKLDKSFARKWFPTLATLMVGLIAGMISSVQVVKSIETTKKARIEERQKDSLAKLIDEREWGYKVIEMYLNKRELFDFTKNYEQAESNLRALSAVAPTVVQSVLNAEKARIPRPGQSDDSTRLKSLAAVEGVQDALTKAKQSNPNPGSSFKSSDFTIYIQYPVEGKEKALSTQSILKDLGYKVPGIDAVSKAPSRLQVRYYRTEQREFAEDLVIQLGKSLGLQSGSDNAILVRSSKDLPDGILEVWLPVNKQE